MGTWIVGGLVLLAVALALRQIWKNRKNGSCQGNCAGCNSACGNRAQPDNRPADAGRQAADCARKTGSDEK